MAEKNKAGVATKCLDYLVSEGGWQIEYLTIDSDEAQADVVLSYTNGSEEHPVPFLIKEQGKWKIDR